MIEGKKCIAIWQPYFFPYIGYWQVIHTADLFFVGDNAHYIKNGWINHNRILGQDDQPQYFGIEVSHASPDRLICETERVVNLKRAEKMCRMLRNCYGKAPYYNEAMEVIRPIIMDEETDLTRYLVKQLRTVAGYLGITTEIRLLSEVSARWDCKAPEVIRRTCLHNGCSDYLNSITGTKFYNKEAFSEMGISLHFIRRNDDICYKQRCEEYVPDLSIIDTMMYCSRDEIHDMLDRYHFV